MERNSNGLLPDTDETVVALPQEREENLSTPKENEADLRQPCYSIPSTTSHREEGTVSTRLQRNKCPPAWLGDLVTGGELDQSLSNSTGLRMQAVNNIRNGTEAIGMSASLRNN